jgi:glycosyltransferase involved in cell wall biosynthesis
MKLPKISIIIPSYNKFDFIEETLKSIFDQKYQNLEVIIQDGGSTDGTIEVIKKFAQKYQIIWETKKDKGQLDAINIGLKKATGDILTFINADDCYEPEALNLISKAYLKNTNALWFAGQGAVINAKGQEIAKLITWYKNFLLSINHKSLILILNYFIQPSVFITKEAYIKCGPFTGTPDFVTEYDLWLKLGKISMPIVINKNISKFRIEKNTKTKMMYKKLLIEDERIVKKYTNNIFILIFHRLNNLGRILVEKLV